MDLPEIGLGTMGISDPDVIETALELGYRHLDTAQVYGNESVVGDGLAQSSVDRSDVVVATKVWADKLTPPALRESTEESLEKLGLETVDLLYVHRPIEDYEPSVTLPAMEQLLEDGLTRHIGVSNFEIDELAQAREILSVPIGAHQTEYHPLFQRPALREDALEHDEWLVAYSPLSAGRVDDIEVIKEIAATHDTTPAAISLAWLCQYESVHPIPKASSRAHLEANLEATALELTDEEVTQIESIEEENELFPE